MKSEIDTPEDLLKESGVYLDRHREMWVVTKEGQAFLVCSEEGFTPLTINPRIAPYTKVEVA